MFQLHRCWIPSEKTAFRKTKVTVEDSKKIKQALKNIQMEQTTKNGTNNKEYKNYNKRT